MNNNAFVAWLVRFCFFLWACTAAIPLANAGPANPEPQRISQPDGSWFQAVMQGDEFQGWMETDDGYTVVRNPASGFFEYAIHGPGGQLSPSGILVAAGSGALRSPAQGQMPPKGLRPPRNTALEQHQEDFLEALRADRQSRAPMAPEAAPAPTGTWAPTPVSGTKNMLMILVNFQDATLTGGSATYWYNAVFAPSGASLVKYYQDNSFGTLSVVPVPHSQAGNPAGVVSVTLAQNHPNCASGSCDYATETAWINSALAAAAPYVNFAALDTNGNGAIGVEEAAIYFIVAGYETSAGSGLTPTYWAHAWGGSGVAVAGKTIGRWALNGAQYNAATAMQMGVIAHEMGHAMAGLPDLYDTSYSNAGLGTFSLMAGGSWGRRAGETGGATPVALDAWSRQYLGWSTPQYPLNGATVSFDAPLSGPSAPVMLMNEAFSTSEYWLVENRPPIGWDAGMYPYLGTWTGGLLVQHIDLNVGTKAGNSFNRYVAGAHQGNMAEEPATATCSLKVVTSPATYSRGCPTILFYSGNATAFNGGSTPNSAYYSGTPSGLGVSAISAPGSSMTGTVQTTVTSGTLPSAPTGVAATAGNGQITVAFTPGALGTGTLVSHTAMCGGGSATGASSPIVVGGLVNGTPYNCMVRTTTSVGTSPWSAASNTVTPMAPDDGFPPGGALPAGWTSPGGSNAAWVVATDSVYAGSSSLKSGAIGNGQTSDLSYTGAFAAGTISFARRVSSEANWDFLEFYIDGVLQNSWSGEQAWGVVSFPITAGNHTLLWRYLKDAICCVGGADAAWIDSVSLPASPPGAPTNVVAVAGPGSATISFTPPAGSAGITGYTATCTASGYPTRTATGTGSPITVKGLTGGVVYSCTVAATNSAGTGAASAAAAVTPRANIGVLVPFLLQFMD